MLPDLYQRWVTEILGGEVPGESRATCHDCVMAKPQEPGGAAPFDPATKCCTYDPGVPNFLAGRLLADESPEAAHARRAMEARIAGRAGVLPTLVMPPVEYRAAYQSSPAVFGRSRALRCPYFVEDTGGCGMYRHRGSVCATWHCRYDRGMVGRGFWRAMEVLLTSVEVDLSAWAAMEVGLGEDALRVLFAPRERQTEPRPDFEVTELDRDPGLYAQVWGEWVGREAEYYRACASAVEGLSAREVLAACGPHVRGYAALLQSAYGGMASARLPERVRLAPFEVRGVDASGAVLLNSYGNPMDPYRVPATLLAALPLFDGRPTRDAARGAYDVAGVELDEARLRELLDFGVLVPASALVRRDPDDDEVG